MLRRGNAQAERRTREYLNSRYFTSQLEFKGLDLGESTCSTVNSTNYKMLGCLLTPYLESIEACNLQVAGLTVYSTVGQKYKLNNVTWKNPRLFHIYPVIPYTVSVLLKQLYELHAVTSLMSWNQYHSTLETREPDLVLVRLDVSSILASLNHGQTFRDPQYCDIFCWAGADCSQAARFATHPEFVLPQHLMSDPKISKQSLISIFYATIMHDIS